MERTLAVTDLSDACAHRYVNVRDDGRCFRFRVPQKQKLYVANGNQILGPRPSRADDRQRSAEASRVGGDTVADT